MKSSSELLSLFSPVCYKLKKEMENETGQQRKYGNLSFAPGRTEFNSSESSYGTFDARYFNTYFEFY